MKKRPSFGSAKTQAGKSARAGGFSAEKGRGFKGGKKAAPAGKAGPKRPYAKQESRTAGKAFVEKRGFEKRGAAPSSSAPKFKRKSEGLSLPAGQVLWGVHAVREAWLNPARKILGLWASESGLAAMDEILEEAAARGFARPSPSRAERDVIDGSLPRGTVHQGLLLVAAPLPEMDLDDLLGLDEGPRLVVVLDQVTDPHNVGAVLRSAAAFGAGAVIVTERHAPATTGVLAKTACGAAEHVPLIPVVNLARALQALQGEGFWCVGLAEEGEHDLAACKLGEGRIALVLGAEGEGLRRLTRAQCDEIARLPTGDAIGSLNVSNAAAVALYEAKRQSV